MNKTTEERLERLERLQKKDKRRIDFLFYVCWFLILYIIGLIPLL